MRFSREVLLKFTEGLLAECGVPKSDGKRIADCILDSDLRGVQSHGIMRLPAYVKLFKKTGVGGINPNPDIRVVKEAPSFAVFDGDNGLGHIVSIKAMEATIKKAEKVGFACALANRSNHNGAEAYFTLMAAEKDMIGFIVTAGGMNLIAPTGGLTPSLGNNPFSYAIPSHEEPPLVLDMSCSVVARGWIVLAAKNGWSIPEGWAVDKNGNPTTDAQEALNGFVLPFGGYKGYGIAMINAALGGILAGATIDDKGTDIYKDAGREQNIGHFMWVLNIGMFMEVMDFKKKTDELIRRIRGSRLAPNVERIFVPGEKEAETKKRNLQEGIPVSVEVYNEIRQLGFSH